MLKPEDVRVGNLIQYDHDERRKPPVCMQRGFVKEIHTDYVVLSNGEKRKWERTEGIPIDEGLLERLSKGKIESWALIHSDGMTEITFVKNGVPTKRIFQAYYYHQLQNQYEDFMGEKLEITVPEPPPIHPQQ